MAEVVRDNDYVADGNEAVNFKLIRDVSDMTDDKLIFKPAMSHQIFGPAEKIFGYKDLQINLYFSASRLNPYMDVKYSEVASEKSSEIEPDDIATILNKSLLITFNRNENDFVRSLDDEMKFKPMGILRHSFLVADDEGDRCFCIYTCDTSTIGLIPYHEKLQTFIMWYIDAASYIDVDDDKWKFFLLFEKYKKNGDDIYAIAGFSTVYEYYAYPEHIRPRISQMLVLPPFQRQGLGAELFQAIYSYYQNDSKVIDITVENPSDELQWVRNFVDCQMVADEAKSRGEKLQLDTIIEIALKFKINKKQARRVYEILRLKNINRDNKEEYRSYRLEVKKRLNIPYHNEINKMKKIEQRMKPQEVAELRSKLMLNEEHRLGTLHELYKELEEEYDRVIRRLVEPN